MQYFLKRLSRFTTESGVVEFTIHQWWNESSVHGKTGRQWTISKQLEDLDFADDSNDSGPNIDGPMINDRPIMDRI